MGIGCFVTIVAALIQTFSPQYNLRAFIADRVLIGLGQGIALSKSLSKPPWFSYLQHLIVTTTNDISKPRVQFTSES
jgi:hypothetical protein